MADEEFLPFAQNSFDLVASSLRYGIAIKFHRMRFYSLFVIIVRARWCTGQLVRHLIMELEGWVLTSYLKNPVELSGFIMVRKLLFCVTTRMAWILPFGPCHLFNAFPR